MRSYTLAREDKIIEILRQHRGAENGVTREEICKILHESGFSCSPNSLRKIIESIRKLRKTPIWCNTKGGFFWIETSDDAKQAIHSIQLNIDTLNETKDFLCAIYGKLLIEEERKCK